MKLPIYELKINENLDDEAQVSAIALVDEPAIKKDFLAFADEEFINPEKNESEDDFIKRCMSYVTDEGKDQDQAYAICQSLWQNHFKQDFEETYNDYPKQAVENAKIALRWAEKNGWGDCGEATGKQRANQLANNEKLSRETIARMASFERHRQNSTRQLGDGCGRLMWLAWGGDEGIEWAKRKLEQIDKEKFAGGVSFDFDGVLTTTNGIKLLDDAVKRGTNVFIISARSHDNDLKEFAKKHGVDLSNVYATGSNKAKIEKIKELQIAKHYDNNSDVIDAIGNIGEKFAHYFQIVNEEQHIISGCLMEADLLIYRRNERFGEHYVKFSADTIKKIAIKFAKQKFQNKVNLMHDKDQMVDGVTMFESFIVDKKRGILPMKDFQNVADGSWFGSFYVENESVWQSIKEGKFKGFSVEGMFDYEEPISPEENALKKISELLNELTD